MTALALAAAARLIAGERADAVLARIDGAAEARALAATWARADRRARAATIAAVIAEVRSPAPEVHEVHDDHVAAIIGDDAIARRAWHGDAAVPAPVRVWWQRRISADWPMLPPARAQAPTTLAELATLSPAHLAAALTIVGAALVLHVAAEAGVAAVGAVAPRLGAAAALVTAARAAVADAALRAELGAVREVTRLVRGIAIESAGALHGLGARAVGPLLSPEVAAQLRLRSPLSSPLPLPSPTAASVSGLLGLLARTAPAWLAPTVSSRQ